MKLEEIKKDIIEELDGQLIVGGLKDYIENPSDITKNYTPTMWLFNFTEIEMSMEKLDSIYCVPVEKDFELVDFVNKHKISTAKKCLIYLGTSDGVIADEVYSVYPMSITKSEMDRIDDKIRYYVLS